MKCKVNLETDPITLCVLPQYLGKDELETINRVGHNGTITLFTMDGAIADCMDRQDNERKRTNDRSHQAK